MIELCRKMRGGGGNLYSSFFSPDSGVNEKEVGKINAAKLCQKSIGKEESHSFPRARHGESDARRAIGRQCATLGALACRTGQDRKLTCEKETTDSFLYSTAVAPKYMY